MVLLILTKYISFQLLINRKQRRVSKNNSKKTKKTRQSSDFKLECTKTFLMKFCQHGSIFRQIFQVFLEYALREDDKNTSLTPFRYLNTKDYRKSPLSKNSTFRGHIDNTLRPKKTFSSKCFKTLNWCRFFWSF